MVNISIDEAKKKSFLEILQLVEEKGTAIALKDGKQYLVLEYNINEIDDEYIDSAKFRGIAEKVLNRHIEAFKELAK